MNNYCVYIHKFPNGKNYIGIAKNIKTRWNKGYGYINNKIFFEAVKEYGWSNIQHIILYKNISKEEAWEKEEKLINEYKSNNPLFGYNIAKGGKHNSPNTEFKKGRTSIRKGIKLSDEIKQKISKSKKGKKIINTDNYHKYGEQNPFYGRHHTEEAKEKMSFAHKGMISKKRKKVKCVELNKIYDSIKIASLETKTQASKICNCCQGKGITANGYHWEYLDKIESEEK